MKTSSASSVALHRNRNRWEQIITAFLWLHFILLMCIKSARKTQSIRLLFYLVTDYEWENRSLSVNEIKIASSHLTHH